MSFLRYGEIYPCGKGTISRPCPRPSRWMSFQLAIPGGLLSSRARVRFTSRRHSAAAAALMSTQLHRTVLCDCSGCLSPGVHRNALAICLFVFLFVIIGGSLHLSPSGAFLAATTGTPLVIYAFHRRTDGASRRNEVPCDAGRNEVEYVSKRVNADW